MSVHAVGVSFCTEILRMITQNNDSCSRKGYEKTFQTFLVSHRLGLHVTRSSQHNIAALLSEIPRISGRPQLRTAEPDQRGRVRRRLPHRLSGGSHVALPVPPPPPLPPPPLPLLPAQTPAAPGPATPTTHGATVPRVPPQPPRREGTSLRRRSAPQHRGGRSAARPAGPSPDTATSPLVETGTDWNFIIAVRVPWWHAAIALVLHSAPLYCPSL